MKTAIVFSGQGSQYSGMGKELYDKFPSCRELFDKADKALDFPLLEYMFNPDYKSRLDDTEFCQPAIFTVCAGILKIIEDTGFRADTTAGLSLGEYTALMYSGALDFSSTLTLLQKRGQYMSEAAKQSDGVMSAILNLPPEKVAEACLEASKSSVVTISNLNAPGQVVISGERHALEKAEELCLLKGAKRCLRLAVSGAYHTAYMNPASEKLAKYLNSITVNDMQISVVSNTDGNIIASKDDIAPTLLKQLVMPVEWEKCVKTMISADTGIFLEIGPGRVLSGFIKRISKDVKTYNIENLESYYNTTKELFISQGE